jgi:hypothetical protein
MGGGSRLGRLPQASLDPVAPAQCRMADKARDLVQVDVIAYGDMNQQQKEALNQIP